MFAAVTLLAQPVFMTVQSYSELDAWKRGLDFVVAVYGVTRRFPREELDGPTSQLRRAAVAVPSNISGEHQQERVYLRHVLIALGSMAEAETQLEIALRMKYVSQSEVGSATTVAGHVRRSLFGLRRALRQTIKDSESPLI